MWQEAELVLRNYIPSEITLGMFFIKKLTNEQQELFVISKNVHEDVETFIEKNGFPVKLFIETEIDNDVQLSEELHSNSVFDTEKLDYYNTTSIKQLNNIINLYEGFFEVLINEEYTDFEKINEKFIIRYLTE